MNLRVGGDLEVPYGGDDSAVVEFSLSPQSVLISIYNKKYAYGQAVHFHLNKTSIGAILAVVRKIIATNPRFDESVDLKVLTHKGRYEEVESEFARVYSTKLQIKSFSNDSSVVFYLPRENRLRFEVGKNNVAVTTEEQLRKSIKVMIVDDSASVRKLLRSILTSDPQIEIVAEASDPEQADEMLKTVNPDVMTLDIHMPKMDGVTYLKKLMSKRPLPVVMISSISMEESSSVLDALENGAVDYLQKPSIDQLQSAIPVILEKVKAASRANLTLRSVKNLQPLVSVSHHLDQSTVVAIGSSTGGTEALKVILEHLPENIPPIVIVQHIPAVFSLAFANRLNQICKFEVKEARDGDEVVPNKVLIAPGGLQMKVHKYAGSLRVRIEDSPPVNRHKPSVDVLFNSVAEQIGKQSIGIILTGMGTDGAQGLLHMRENGCHTIAQDEASSVVFGMPREAIRMKAAIEVLPLNRIAVKLMERLNKAKKAG